MFCGPKSKERAAEKQAIGESAHSGIGETAVNAKAIAQTAEAAALADTLT